MKQTRMNILGLAALVLLLIVVYVGHADAKTRGPRGSRRSDLQVRVSGTHSVSDGIQLKGLPRLRRQLDLKLSKLDRQIASRLAKYTGVPKRRLIRLRKMGYRWMQIGRWLELPRPVVRAASSAMSWHRFLRHRESLAWCEIGGNPGRHDDRQGGRRGNRGGR